MEDLRRELVEVRKSPSVRSPSLESPRRKKPVRGVGLVRYEESPLYPPVPQGEESGESHLPYPGEGEVDPVGSIEVDMVNDVPGPQPPAAKGGTSET